MSGQKILKEQYDQTREDYMPWLNVGKEAIGVLRRGAANGIFEMPKWIPPDADTVKERPGYQYRLAEGEKAIRRSAAMMGTSPRSGATMKELTKYGQDIASEEYDAAYQRSLQEYTVEGNRRAMKYNRYANMAGMGQQALSQLSGYGARNAENQAGLGIQGASAQGQGLVGSANSMIQGTLYGNQAQQQHFENMMSVLNFGFKAFG